MGKDRLLAPFNINEQQCFLDVEPFVCTKFGFAELLARHMETVLRVIDFKYENVLDVGCGVGPLCLIWCSYGAHVTGVDLNPIAIKCCKSNLFRFGYDKKSNIIQADFSKWHTTEKFDIIVSNPPISFSTYSFAEKFPIEIETKWNSEDFSFFTNAWRDEHGKNLVDYIFMQARQLLYSKGRIIILFNDIENNIPEYIFKKCEKYGYKLDFLHSEKLLASTVGITSLPITEITGYLGIWSL